MNLRGESVKLASLKHSTLRVTPFKEQKVRMHERLKAENDGWNIWSSWVSGSIRFMRAAFPFSRDFFKSLTLSITVNTVYNLSFNGAMNMDDT